MEFLRPVEIARPARARGKGRVDRLLLPRCRTREETQQRHRILQARHHLFNGSKHDVDARQSLGEIAIALVGDDGGRPLIGDEEIGAGDADIGLQESGAEFRARLGHQACRIVQVALGVKLGMRLAEGFLDLSLRHMKCRADEMRRRLAAQLDDIFAEIGLDGLDAVRFEKGVDTDLLADHRFALGDGLCVHLTADLQHLRPRRIAVGAPMHLATARDHRLLELQQVSIEMGDDVGLQIAADITQLLEFGHLGDGVEPRLDRMSARDLEGFLKRRILQRPLRIRLEGVGGGLEAHERVSSPIAG